MVAVMVGCFSGRRWPPLLRQRIRPRECFSHLRIHLLGNDLDGPSESYCVSRDVHAVRVYGKANERGGIRAKKVLSIAIALQVYFCRLTYIT